MTGTGCAGVHLIGGPNTHQRVRVCVQYKGSARVIVQGCLRASHGREHWRCGVLKVPGSTREGGKGRSGSVTVRCDWLTKRRQTG